MRQMRCERERDNINFTERDTYNWRHPQNLALLDVGIIAMWSDMSFHTYDNANSYLYPKVIVS